VAIPRFLCGSPRPCRLNTAPFWPRWEALSCVLTACQVFIVPNKPSSFCNYLVEPHLPASCGAFYFWRGNEVEGQDFISRAGVRFWLSRELQIVVIREILRESSVWRGGQVFSPAGCISIRVTATLLVMSGILPLQSSHSMFDVLLWIWGFGYGYGYDYIVVMIIVFTYLWCWHGSTFCLFMHVLVCRHKHSI
jgi:hypothetical protein